MGLFPLRRIVKSFPSARSCVRRRSRPARRLRCESLEDRRLLAILVSSPVDEIDGNHDPGNLSLREALDIASTTPGNDRIEFDPVVYGETIALDAALQVDSNVEIFLPESEQVTVDAANNSRVFDVPAGVTAAIDGLNITRGGIENAGNLTLSHASVGGSEAPKGGGIFNSGTLTVFETQIIANGTSDGPADQDAGGGGGIYNDAGSVTVLHSEIESNFTGSGGSGGHHGGHGGGIYNNGGSLMIFQSSLASNYTGNGNSSSIAGDGGAGGAIYNQSGTVHIEYSTLSGNFTGQGGDGADFAGDGGHGGAVYSAGGSLTVAHSSFTTNMTGLGGISSLAAGGNGGSGGSVYANAATVTVEETQFLQNSTGAGGNAVEWAGRGGHGGAVYAANSTVPVVVRHSRLQDNHTGNGGAGSGTDSLGGHGGSGGAVYVDAADLIAETSTLDANYTGSGGNAGTWGGDGGDGGGIVVFRASATISGSLLTANNTGGNGTGGIISGDAGDGGGVYNEPSDAAKLLTIANTTIDDNAASHNGGGIAHWGDATANVTNATITRNTALSGGGVWTVDDTITLHNTIVATNSSGDVSGIPNNASSHNLIGGDPVLGPLTDNGGLTLSRIPLAGSPAIDAGSNARAADAGLAGDQRGYYRVADGDGNGSQLVDMGAVEYGATMAADVVARHVFYNDSYFDDGPAANAADDGALALTPAEASHPELGKTPLLPGQSATFQNVTSYDKGINGIMIDVFGLADAGGLSATDFEFKTGNDDNPAAWADAPPPSSVTVRTGAGEGGSDRVTLVWPNYTPPSPNPAVQAVAGAWLEVTMLVTANTGLLTPDVFYFGNALADSGTGNTDDHALVSAIDFGAVRDNPRSPNNRAGIDHFADYNRDSLVNAVDFGLVRDNPASPSTALALITVPAPASPAALRDAALQDFELAGNDPAEEETAGTLPASLIWLDDADTSVSSGSTTSATDQSRSAVERVLATL